MSECVTLFDFYQCEECLLTFSIQSDEIEEPTCQCGCSDNRFIGTIPIEIGVIQGDEPEVQRPTIELLPSA